MQETNQDVIELPLNDIQSNLYHATGNSKLAKTHAEALAIYYRGEVVDLVSN